MSGAGEAWTRVSALHREGRIADAIAGYDEILRANPRHAAALHYSGVAHYQLGQLRPAFERLRAAVAIDAADADAWSNLGLVLQAIGHWRAALEVFEKAVALAPDAPELLANLASGQSAAGRHADAEATARKLIARDPTFAKAWLILSLALQTQGRMLEALEAVTRAAGLAPDQESHAGVKAQIERWKSINPWLTLFEEFMI